MKLSTLFSAYRALREQERKQKDYNRLVGSDLSYTILRDLINSATFGVVVNVRLKDGTTLELRREDEFEKHRNRHAGTEGLF
jgi:hypothetical protein